MARISGAQEGRRAVDQPAETRLSGGLPQRWWQWVLLYPAVAVALIGAAPQWIDRGLALFHNTNTKSYSEAQQQAELWRRNLSCAALPFHWYSNPDNVRIDATICDSGDIFIRAATPRNEQFFRWVPVHEVVKGAQGAGAGQVTAAVATPDLLVERHGGGLLSLASLRSEDELRAAITPVQFNNAVVVCQRFVDGRHILRHVRTPTGCFDEVVDTYSGALVQRVPVPCRMGC